MFTVTRACQIGTYFNNIYNLSLLITKDKYLFCLTEESMMYILAYFYIYIIWVYAYIRNYIFNGSQIVSNSGGVSRWPYNNSSGKKTLLKLNVM